MNDTTLRNKNVRLKLNVQLNTLKEQHKGIDISSLAKQYNTSRASIGRMLSERRYEIGDIQRKRVSQNYCPAIWEFVDAE